MNNATHKAKGQAIVARIEHGDKALEDEQPGIANFDDIIPSLTFGFQTATVKLTLPAKTWIMLYECAQRPLGDVSVLIMELLDSRETLTERWARESTPGQWLVNHLKENAKAASTENGGEK